MLATMTEADLNGLWAAMGEADKTALGLKAILTHLPKDDVLLQRGDVVERVYLPITADISNVVQMSDGAMVMASNVGREGITGLAAFLADEPIGWDLLVAVEGAAVMISASVFRDQVRRSPHLQQLLLSLTHFNQIEAAQNAACSTLHSVPARLARWLLMTQDRTGREEFDLKQEDLADLLGAQRTTINSVIRTLSDCEAVQSRRGRIRILDRGALGRQACECYDSIGSARWRRSG